MTIDKAKELKIEVLEEVPEGWRKIKGAMTQPCGYAWYSNGKSRFKGEYKSCLIQEY